MDEGQVRAQIVEYCAQLWQRRLVTGTSGNVSVRITGGDLLVTPARRSLRALDAAELVRTGPDGKPRDADRRPTSELPLHVAAYASRPDVDAVIHAHPTFCVAWSRTGSVFPRDTVGARESLGEVAWIAYEPPGSQALAEATRAAFARGAVIVLMENHGLSAIGPDLEAAFVQTDIAEEAARLAFLRKLI